jgi:hypothetical protein
LHEPGTSDGWTHEQERKSGRSGSINTETSTYSHRYTRPRHPRNQRNNLGRTNKKPNRERCRSQATGVVPESIRQRENNTKHNK